MEQVTLFADLADAGRTGVLRTQQFRIEAPAGALAHLSSLEIAGAVRRRQAFGYGNRP
jgi:hypothetical protein